MNSSVELLFSKSNYQQFYFVASLFLEHECFNYTFTDCYPAYKEYRKSSTKQTHNPEVKLLSITEVAAHTNHYPDGTGTGLNELKKKFGNSVLRIDLTSREVWDFDISKPIMNSHESPGKIVHSDELLMDIYFVFKKYSYQLSYNKRNDELRCSIPVTSDVKKEYMEAAVLRAGFKT